MRSCRATRSRRVLSWSIKGRINPATSAPEIPPAGVEWKLPPTESSWLRTGEEVPSEADQAAGCSASREDLPDLDQQGGASGTGLTPGGTLRQPGPFTRAGHS